MTITRFDFDTRIHHGVVHNGTVYLTGQVGTPGTSAAAQMQEVLDKIDRLLAKAGTSRDKILHVQMWLDDIRDFDAVNRVWMAGSRRNMRPPAPAARGEWQSRGCW